MGMFNEIYLDCPCCNSVLTYQVRQFVLGFGGFNLSDSASLTELSDNDLREILEELSGKWVYCETCDESFRWHTDPVPDEERQMLLRELATGRLR
jgi:hypothetical protein